MPILWQKSPPKRNMQALVSEIFRLFRIYFNPIAIYSDYKNKNKIYDCNLDNFRDLGDMPYSVGMAGT